MSTTNTSAPTCRASTLTAAPPARKFAIIEAVTSCGQGVTPCACTPWSPAKTATTGRVSAAGGQVRWIPQSRTDASSRAPSDPAGLVSWAWRSRASVIASSSSGSIADSTSDRRGSVMPAILPVPAATPRTGPVGGTPRYVRRCPDRARVKENR